MTSIERLFYEKLVEILGASGGGGSTDLTNVETLIGTANANLVALAGYTDTLEALTAATNAALATMAGYVDGLETLIALTNTALAAVATETTLAAQSAKLPTALTIGGSFKVAILEPSEFHLGEVSGNLVLVSTEFTRPADGNIYAANDIVSNSTSTTTMQALASAARVSGGSGYIVGIRISTDKKSITPRFRVHFFNTTGVTLAADNALHTEVYADLSKRVGYYDMPAMSTGADTANSDMSRAIDMTVRIPYVCAVTSLYYVLETLDVFTPASGEKFTVSCYLDRN